MTESTWTYDRIVELIRASTWEGLGIDFKVDIPRRADAPEKDAFLRSVVGMANALGGFMVLGVDDPSNFATRPIEEIVIGFPPNRDIPHEVQKRLAGVSPAIEFEPVGPRIQIPNSDKCLVVIEIPRTKIGAHPLPDGRFVIRRSGSGTEPMSYYEVRSAMVSTLEAEGRLKMLRAYLAQVQEIARQSHDHGYGLWSTPDRFDPQSLERIAIEAVVLMPGQTAAFEDVLEISRHCRHVNTRLSTIRDYKNTNDVTLKIMASLREIDRLSGQLIKRIQTYALGEE